MTPEAVLVHLVVVLVAARLAAEAAERTGQATVLLEIVAGIVIGPSVLGLVHSDEFLTALGEVGAVLLLFEVGLQMNLRELTRVGGDSLRVAAIGILLPMFLAVPALTASGAPQAVALFLAGGITATSVGITARVFGDLRALATPEARTVLGAAVADDVGGLLILTFVVAVASGGQVSVPELASTLGGAVGFVLAGSAAAIWLAPRLFARISKRARADGTLMVLGLVFALVVARAASAAHLAPIVGAFIAGLALSGSEVRDEVQRRLVPVAHVLVPIFFLMIGVQTRLSVFSDPSVVGVAAMLSLIAVGGKIAAGLGVRRGKANRLLVGVAMIPRGEVGLIFAGIGLAGGVLSPRYYAMLVVVVLVTTLVTPPMVRQLIVRARRRASVRIPAGSEPRASWLSVTRFEVELAAGPPDVLALQLGLEAAVLCTNREPGPELLAWLSAVEPQAVEWSRAERAAFFQLLRSGNQRSWRLLEVTGLMGRYLPVVEAAVGRRKRDSFSLEPGADLHFPFLEELRDLVAGPPRADGVANRARTLWDRLPDKDRVYLAAFGASIFEGDDDPAASTAALATSVGMGAADAAAVAFLVRERHLLRAAARRVDMGTEESVLELAAHVAPAERADALYILSLAGGGMSGWERERLDEQFELLRSALAHPDFADAGDVGLVQARREQIASALRHLPPDDVSSHLRAAPRRYLVAHSPEVVARHLRMTGTPLGRFEVRLQAEPVGREAGSPTGGEGVPAGREQWAVHIAVKDRPGLLASIAWGLAANDVSVGEAIVATWRDGKAIDVFRVTTPPGIDWDDVRQSITDALVHGTNGGRPAPIQGTVDIDNVASPWYSIVEVRARDRSGLLHKVASALAGAGVQIHMAFVTTRDGMAVDIFHVTGADGGKLDPSGERVLRAALLSTAQPRRWRRLRPGDADGHTNGKAPDAQGPSPGRGPSLLDKEPPA